MQRLWKWLTDPKHQKTLAFLGTGLVIFVGAGWTVYQEFFKGSSPSPMRVVENACGVGVGGGDVTISGITCTFGITLAEYQEALAKREEALRAEFEAAAEDTARQITLEQNLDAVRKRLGDVEAAFEARNATFTELARSLEEGPPDPETTRIFEKAVATGDTSALQEWLRADLDADVTRQHHITMVNQHHEIAALE